MRWEQTLPRFAPLLAWVCLGLIAEEGRATVVIAQGIVNQPQDRPVILNDGTSGTTVYGVTNVESIQVQFSSGQTLFEPTAGADRIQAFSGSSRVPLNDITITVPSGTYESLIFNAFLGNVGDGGRLSISVQDNVVPSPTAMDFQLGVGDNFFTISTDAVQTITSTTLTVTGQGRPGLTDLRQIRINPTGGLVVPEPATIASALSGVGILGLASLRRLGRRVKRAAT